jgi:hypothetical protein
VVPPQKLRVVQSIKLNDQNVKKWHGILAIATKSSLVEEGIHSNLV